MVLPILGLVFLIIHLKKSKLRLKLVFLIYIIHRRIKWARVFNFLIGIRNYFGEFLFSIRVSLWQREKFLYLSLYSCAWLLPTPEYPAGLLEMRRLFLDNTNLTGQFIFPYVVFCVTYLTLFRSFSLAPSTLSCHFLFVQQTKRHLTSTKHTCLQKINEKSVDINFL